MTVAATGLNEAAARAAGIAFDKTVTFSASHATYYPGATNMTVKTLFSPETGRLLGAQIVGFEDVYKRQGKTRRRAPIPAIFLKRARIKF